MAKVPIRVPPPKATTVSEQWVIDSLLHLDDCLDEHKRNSDRSHEALMTQMTELRAEVTAALTAVTASDVDLDKRIAAHQAFHDRMDAAKDAQKKERDRWLSPFKRGLDEAPKLLIGLVLLAAGGVGYIVGLFL